MLIVVPARKGSKGVPGKNRRDFCGAPLICWSLAAAGFLAPRLGAQVCVTTDDPDIKALMGDITCLERPADLATDQAGMAGVVVDACTRMDADRYVLLQPTTPLRLVSDLAAMADLTLNHDTVVSTTTPADDVEDIVDAATGKMLAPDTSQRRQDREGAYQFIDGAYYSGKVAALIAGQGFKPMGTQYHAQMIPRANDIDTPLDWAMAVTLHDHLVAEGLNFVRPNR